MKIIEFYTSLGHSLGYEFDKEHFMMAGKPVKFKANGKERDVILPVYERLRMGLDDDVHPFHPLCESVLEGQSPTVKFLRKSIMMETQTRAIELIEMFLQVACGKRAPRSALYNNVKAECTEGLKNPKWDDTLLKSWARVKDWFFGNRVPKMMLSVKTKIDDELYARVCNYSSILDEETDEQTLMWFDVKLLRKQDRVIIYRLAKHIFNMFPSECGSNDDRPYFGCMVRAWREFAKKHNALAHSMHEVRNDINKIEEAWFTEVDNLEQYNNKLPTMALNAGDSGGKPKTTKRGVSSVAPPPMASSIKKPVSNEPVATNEPMVDPVKSGRAVTLDDLYSARYAKTRVNQTRSETVGMTAAERRRYEAHKAQQEEYNRQQQALFNTPHNVADSSDNPFSKPTNVDTTTFNPFDHSGNNGSPFANNNNGSINPFSNSANTNNPFGNSDNTNNPFGNSGNNNNPFSNNSNNNNPFGNSGNTANPFDAVGGSSNPFDTNRNPFS